MLSKKKNNPRVTELFIIGRKLNISLVFITKSYFAVIRLNSMPYFNLKIPNKLELQHIAFKDFINLYKKYTAKPFYFLVIDATLALGNPLRFRKNISERI